MEVCLSKSEKQKSNHRLSSLTSHHFSCQHLLKKADVPHQLAIKI